MKYEKNMKNTTVSTEIIFLAAFCTGYTRTMTCRIVCIVMCVFCYKRDMDILSNKIL